MYDVQVDLDEFYQEFEIKVTNPIHRKDALPAKHKIMIALREKYLKHRNVYKRIFREKQSEEFMLSSNSYESRSYEINCSAIIIKNVKKKSVLIRKYKYSNH